MSKLREKNLLLKAFMFVIIPAFLIALFGSFFPLMQALVPLHESDTCICLFFQKDSLNERYFPFMSNTGVKRAWNVLVGINSTTFFLLNWIFLLVIIVAIYKIRKMNDRLEIRKEMTWCVALWSLFDFFQYVFYFFTQMALCPPKA